jgi:acyl-CoA hydrolase
MDRKKTIDSKVIQTDLVLPNDMNNHNTLFGGVLMRKMDAVASISARRHSRTNVVTASTDSVDFLTPIHPTDSICLESFVSWTGKTSMEVFVKAVAENFLTGDRRIAATAFLTFVSLGADGKPTKVPIVVPENVEEKYLHKTGELRAEVRKRRKKSSLELASIISSDLDQK